MIAEYQQCTVSIIGGLDAANGPVPVKVRVHGIGEWGTLGIHLKKHSVWVNDFGDRARDGTCTQRYF